MTELLVPLFWPSMLTHLLSTDQQSRWSTLSTLRLSGDLLIGLSLLAAAAILAWPMFHRARGVTVVTVFLFMLTCGVSQRGIVAT